MKDVVVASQTGAIARDTAMTPRTFAEAVQFATMIAKSTMVPPEYRGKPENILLAMQLGAELGLSPLQALQSVATINGRPAVYGDAMLALVRGSGLCEDIIERIEGEGDARTAICEARRRGATPVFGRFSITDAKRAGLWDKSGPWKQYPLRMLALRARGFALRDAFADVLRGIISAEEASDSPREPRDITPSEKLLTELSGNLREALDTFAAEDTPEPETVPQRAPEEPTEAKIERSQDMIAAVLGPEELGKINVEDLLFQARAAAFDGRKAFDDYYRRLHEGDRLLLRPHLRELQNAARLADGQSATDAPP